MKRTKQTDSAGETPTASDLTGGVDETITVTVRDRSTEPPWGQGLTRVAVRTATISAFCPQPGCGGRRGTPRNLNQCDDGVFYANDVWENPCGHTDYYEAVIAEARERGSLGRVTLR